MSRTRTRKPLLGRMSVFIIGILVGAVLGVAITIMGAPLLDELYPSAFASAPSAPAATSGAAGAEGAEAKAEG